MRLSCLGSGSSGNCFVLEADGQVILLDAGVKFNKIIACKRIKSFKSIAGALVTHEHRDHSASVPELLKAGVEVYSPRNLRAGKKYRIGNLDVLPFKCVHDVINYGYVIRAAGTVIVYATDTAALPPINGVDAWIVECNYTERLWSENVAKAKEGFRYFGRVKESHMGLERLQQYFDGLNKSSKAIILCHLSESGNADAAVMCEAMTPYATTVDIATNGKEWNL